MSVDSWFKWSCCCLLLVCLVPCSQVEAADVERVALLVWHNQGWTGKPADQPLRYAKRDTTLLASVLRQKGRFRTIVLARPTSEQLALALKKIAVRYASSKRRLHFLFYYSGHADEQHLRLGPASQPKRRRFSLKTLASFFKKLRAAVKIGILDACNSGALIDLLHARTKGRGQGYAPFFRMPTTVSQGMAILTSASPHGKARELDRLKSSLFTYHLVQGLWGKADQNRDGKVTSIEAFHYARLRIEQELPGRQQPMYLNHFRGQEGYPITLSYNASLVLPVRPGQRFTLLSKRSVWKFTGRDSHPRVVSVMAGKYKVFLRDRQGHCFFQEVSVDVQKRLFVSPKKWQTASCRSGIAKGGAKAVPIDVQLVDRLPVGKRGRMSASFHAGPINGSPFRPFLGASVGMARKGWRFGFTFLGSQAPQLFVSLTELSIGYGWDLQRYRWHLHLGVLLGVGMLILRHEQTDLSGLSPNLRYGGHAEFSLRLTLRLWLVMRGFFGLAHTVVRSSGEGGEFVNAIAGYGTIGLGYRF